MTNTGVNTTRPPLGLALRSLLRSDFLVLLNSKTSLFLSILLPIVILVANTVGKGQSRLGGSSLVIGLALTLGLLTSGLFGYTLALAHDRDVGVLQRLRITPAPTWMIMTSRVLVQVATNLLASVIVVIVGAIAYGLTLSPGQYLLAIAVSLLGAAVFLSIGQAVVGLVQSTSAINAISRVLMILLLLLGLLGGTGILGDTMKTIAAWSPVGALMTLFADTLNASSWSGQDTNALLACIGYVTVCATIGVRWFRWNSR
ncbi:ABC transporter permease [Pseudarthrobacter sp. fls2-241-R2A-127]|uniref:ABC transporter permease n=1 Tax=Pseudarthrobacter sp. fls2-241-R2A-127 TaxID=3040303 RepID=UPI002554AFA5|nr:ABC transporter permease [Pseudarthrobacter sp. fls2-241-R2A-127]